MSKGAGELLIQYYSGERPDARGRYLSEIQRWPDELIEAVHDFIQWMFPLSEPSGFNPDAPTLDEATISQFRRRPDLQERLRNSLERMLRFYGLKIQYAPNVKVTRDASFERASMNWLSPWNHNHLRITRILKCLRILGLEGEAMAFFDCLAEVYKDQSEQNISDETFRYWRSAVG